MLTTTGLGRVTLPNPLEAAQIAAIEDIEVVRVGLGEVEVEVPGRSNSHVVGPDVHGQGLAVRLLYAVDADEGTAALGVADPYGRAKTGCKADVPGVCEVVGGARLACGGMSDLLVQVVEHGSRTVLHHAPEDMGRHRRLATRQHAPPADLMIVDRLYLAVAILVDALY